MNRVIYVKGECLVITQELYEDYQELTDIDGCLLACAKQDPIGFMCSRLVDHTGKHVGADVDNEIVAVWSQDDED